MEWNGIDLSGVLGGLASLLGLLIAWAVNSLRKKADADTKRSKAETALLKVAAIASAMAQRAWTTLSPQLQAALADGKMSAEERAEIEKSVQVLIKDFTSDDDLKQIAEALGLPLPGVIAKIASLIISTFAFAHDTTNPSQSRLAFPVGASSSGTLPEGDVGHNPG